ncbi:MAG: hypothetical protein LBB65_04935, partial [Burkholderiales bacterium]|nr:hypothetical protein [Burkholderiales bacterium]
MKTAKTVKTGFFSHWLCVALFPALILWGNDIQAASGPVTLEDVPLGTQARVPPTIVMTADDSGSMRSTYSSDTLLTVQKACVIPGPVPPAVGGMSGGTNLSYGPCSNTAQMNQFVANLTWVRNNAPWLTAKPAILSGANANWWDTNFLPDGSGPYCVGGNQATPNLYNAAWYGACPNCCTMYPTGGWGDNTGEIVQATEGICQNGQPPMMASAFNGIAYNPLVTYDPPMRGNGTPFPSFNTSASWANVYWNYPAAGLAWNPLQGSPVNVDMTTQKCYYTTTQYNALSTDYLKGVTSAQLQSAGFVSTAVSGVNAYSIPVHYYRTNVKWCKSNSTRTSAPFNGFANPGVPFGTAADGTISFPNCQDDYDATNNYTIPYYYSPSGINNASYADNTSTPAFDLVVFDLSTPSNPKLNVIIKGAVSTISGAQKIDHSYYDATTGTTQHIYRTASEEVTNYANWAAYYRNRVSATKTAASIAFTQAIPDQADCSNPLPPRVAFNTISPLSGTNTAPAGYVTINNFCGTTNREGFTNKLLVAGASTNTPLRQALNAIGNAFVNNNGTAANRPVAYTCQRSNEIMFTDGMWNDPAPTGTASGNWDGTTLSTTLPALKLANPTATPPTLAIPAAGTAVYGSYGGGPLPAAGQNWPNPIRDYKGAATTLADLALYYWMTPLGGSAADPYDSSVLIKNTRKVSVTARDPATWPHLNFYGMGFGVRGTLPSSNQTATLSRMGDGTNGTYVWPNPGAGGNAASVDDLWHASVNGFGSYVSAQSTQDFSTGLKKILTDILNLGGANAGVAFNNVDLAVAGDKYTYTPSFGSGWGGDIEMKNIGNDGIESAIVPTPKTAAQKLAELLTASTTYPTPWYSPRQIFTTKWSGGGVGNGTATPVPFTQAGISAQMLSTLSETATDPTIAAALQANVIAYLRGDRSREGDTTGKFRVRLGTGPLGDIVDASPVVVSAPSCDSSGCSYDETLNPGYKAFYQANSNRSTMVYAAANDGMLHAFDGTLAGDLKEKWAYMPSDIFRPREQAGIVNLIHQESDIDWPFRHYFYVNATPRVMDVCTVTKCASASQWKTVLIGGLGKGGTSYYALDVTNANAAADEGTTATQKVMWEFTDDNMGYTYGRAIIAKTRAADWGYKTDGDPDGKWVAILPSGYNNGAGDKQAKYGAGTGGDGKGYLYFVDVITGKLLHKIPTPDAPNNGGASPSTPLGIVSIAGYVEDFHNQLVTAVYGADQQGNLWRFNLESSNFADWDKNVTRMAILQDKNNAYQHVTTEPWVQLVTDEFGDDKRWVFVGTGGFRNNDELTAVSPRNTFYAFRDGNKSTVDDPAGSLFTDRKARDNNSNCGATGSDPCGLEPVTGVYNMYSSSNPPPKRQTDNGWYEDMDDGYQIDVNPTAAFGVVAYAANKFTGGLTAGDFAGDPCSSAVYTGRLYARDIYFGGTVFKGGGYY